MIWLMILSPPPPYTVEIIAGNCSEWRSCNFNSQGCCPSLSREFDACCCLETNMLVNFEDTTWPVLQYTDGQQGICCQQEAIQTSIYVSDRSEYDVYCNLPSNINNTPPQWWEGNNLIIIVISGSVVVIIIVILLYFLFRELSPEQVDSITGLVTGVIDAVSDKEQQPRRPQTTTRFIVSDQVLTDIQKIKSKQKREIEVF